MELRLTAKMADSLWESNGHKFAAPLWYIFLYHAKGWQDPKAHRDSEELGSLNHAATPKVSMDRMCVFMPSW